MIFIDILQKDYAHGLFMFLSAYHIPGLHSYDVANLMRCNKQVYQIVLRIIARLKKIDINRTIGWERELYDKVQRLLIKDLIEKINKNILPRYLKELVLDKYNQPLVPGMFPDTLIKLTLCNFNRPLLPGVFPESLTDLRLGKKFNQPLVQDCFPGSLSRLHLGSRLINSAQCIPRIVEKIKRW